MLPSSGIRPKWRDTGLVPKFFIIDYHAFAPLFLSLVKWDLNLLYFSLCIVGFLAIVKIWSITPMGLLRAARIKLTGKIRYTDVSSMTIKRRVRW